MRVLATKPRELQTLPRQRDPSISFSRNINSSFSSFSFVTDCKDIIKSINIKEYILSIRISILDVTAPIQLGTEVLYLGKVE